MVVNKAFVASEEEFSANKLKEYNRSHDEVLSLDESLDLAGNGWYGRALLLILSVGTMAMGMDLFGFSVVVAGAACDLELDLHQTSILLAMPFIGPIVMSYPWGYISDVFGRKRSLLISLWGSFIISVISSFCPSWQLLAALKFVSTSLSSCAQSATYTLLGESTPRAVRDGYMLIMTSVLDFMLAVYMAIAYGILNYSSTLELVIMRFPPWRLLALVLSGFLGLGAAGLHCFHESPKFLLNAGKEDQALMVLKSIWRWNRGKVEDFPVSKVYLAEAGNISAPSSPLLRGLWQQAAPLLRPPLLCRTLQLYFLTAVIFGTSNPYFIWFPMLAQKFFEGVDSGGGGGMCSLIVDSYNNDTATGKCTSSVEVSVVWATLAQGLVFVAILFALSWFANRKRLIIIIILSISCLCGMGAVLVPNSSLSFFFFFGQLANELAIGVIYSYFVDLYPTSYRGMATCLGTMVSRISALLGIYTVGAFVMTHCSYTFFVCSSLMACGVLVSFMLPSDRISK